MADYSRSSFAASPAPPYSNPSYSDAESERWRELYGPQIVPPPPPQRRSALLLYGLAAIVGIAGVALYFALTRPSGNGSAAEPAKAEESQVNPSTGFGFKKHASVRRHSAEAAPADADATAGGMTIVSANRPEPSPPAIIEVISGTRRYLLTVSSVAYHVDVRSGTVVLVRNDAPATMASVSAVAGYVTPSEVPVADTSPVEGTVVLRVAIDPAGTVHEVEVVSGTPPLTAAAIEAVRQWRFVPAANAPQTGITHTTITITFRSSK